MRPKPEIASEAACTSPASQSIELQNAHETADSLARPLSLAPWQHAAIFLLTCLLLFSRRPDAILDPQFYGEGGKNFFADAYNLGAWSALFRILEGYLQVLPRLAAALALLVPLSSAPLLLNLIALCVQAMPVNILLNARSAAWGPLRLRAMMAAVYVALPNSFEVYSDITNAHWLLALSALLLLVAAVPRSPAGRLFDLGVIAVFGLSGPFCIFLAPLSVSLAWVRRERWRWTSAGVLATSLIVQIGALLFLAPAHRSHRELGIDLLLFMRILGSQIYFGTLFGNTAIAARHGLHATIFLCAVAATGTALAIHCFRNSQAPMRIFLTFCTSVFLASFVSPIGFVLSGNTVWQQLAMAPGIRYWFFPSLGIAWCLIWSLHQRNRDLRGLSLVLLLLMGIGIVRDWRRPALPDSHFSESLQRFRAAPAGTTVTIPECPPGWTIQLVKHPTNP